MNRALRPDVLPADQTLGPPRATLRAEVDDAVVEALTAALVASFRRDPVATDGSPQGSDHQIAAAS